MHLFQKKIYCMVHRKYFGTDGIRGKFGNNPITAEFFIQLGIAAGNVLCKHATSCIVVIGNDTRESGPILKSALAAGLSCSGISSLLIGTIPTPAVSYLTKFFQAEAGISISASHNPFNDNGVKFFSRSGKKLPKIVENKIEKELFKLSCNQNNLLCQQKYQQTNGIQQYLKFCESTIPNNLNLTGLSIVVDCAHGATYQIAPTLLRKLGANVIAISCKPNGININHECGTTNIFPLRYRVLKEKADLGIAYDGDGDRLIMIDHLGNVVDGDQILYILVRDKIKNKKFHGGVVGTLMSNMGLEIALKRLGVPFLRSHIGDRYILKTLEENGWTIGAENSGHIILLEHSSTGDAIVAGLQILSIIVHNKTTLKNLCNGIQLLPQILINVQLNKQSDPLKSHAVKRVSAVARETLAGNGRILLRKSGTEPLVRIMVEGTEATKVIKLAYHIATIVKSER